MWQGSTLTLPHNLGEIEGLSQEDGESGLKDLHWHPKGLDFIPVGREELLTDAVALNKIRARELKVMSNMEGSKEMFVGRMKKAQNIHGNASKSHPQVAKVAFEWDSKQKA